MKKRGQMYLITALIIAALIISLGAIYNYARSSKEDATIFDLSKEIDYETSRVIDRGIFKQENINQQVENISEYYANLNPRSELITVFGNFTQVVAYHYKLDETGRICIQTGACSGITIFKKIKEPLAPIRDPNTGIITIMLAEGTEYKFELKSGQNFYIVLIKENDSEKFVASPERET